MTDVKRLFVIDSEDIGRTFTAAGKKALSSEDYFIIIFRRTGPTPAPSLDQLLSPDVYSEDCRDQFGAIILDSSIIDQAASRIAEAVEAVANNKTNIFFVRQARKMRQGVHELLQTGACTAECDTLKRQGGTNVVVKHKLRVSDVGEWISSIEEPAPISAQNAELGARQGVTAESQNKRDVSDAEMAAVPESSAKIQGTKSESKPQAVTSQKGGVTSTGQVRKQEPPIPAQTPNCESGEESRPEVIPTVQEIAIPEQEQNRRRLEKSILGSTFLYKKKEYGRTNIEIAKDALVSVLRARLVSHICAAFPRLSVGEGEEERKSNARLFDILIPQLAKAKTLEGAQRSWRVVFATQAGVLDEVSGEGVFSQVHEEAVLFAEYGTLLYEEDIF